MVQRSRKGRRKAGGRRKRVPGWVWLSLGVVLGLGIATGFLLAGLLEVPDKSLPKPAVRPSPPREQPEEAPPPARTLKKPDYSFYDALESDQARLPQARPQARTGPKYHYWLQLGAFRKAADADALKARLALMGVESRILVSNSNGQRWHKVRVGPFEGKRARQAVLGKLQAAGFEPLLLRERVEARP